MLWRVISKLTIGTSRSRRFTRRKLRRHSGRSEVGKYVLAALLIVAAASASVAIWYQYVTAERPPTLDRTTYCPLSGPRAVTVLLLDTSDDLPEIGKREVQKYLLDRAEAVPTYGLLDIRQLDPIALGGRVVFSMQSGRWLESKRVSGQSSFSEQALARGLSCTTAAGALGRLGAAGLQHFAYHGCYSGHRSGSIYGTRRRNHVEAVDRGVRFG